jgi:hypothetical protein
MASVSAAMTTSCSVRQWRAQAYWPPERSATLVDNTSAPDQIRYVLSDAGSRIVVAESGFVDVLETARDLGAPIDQILVIDPSEDDDDEHESLRDELGAEVTSLDFAIADELSPDDIFTLIYTSGTTGPSKGVEVVKEQVDRAVTQGVTVGSARKPPTRSRRSSCSHEYDTRRQTARNDGVAREFLGWVQFRAPVARHSCPDDRQKVDLLVVGGGFTGLWTALGP